MSKHRSPRAPRIAPRNSFTRSFIISAALGFAPLLACGGSQAQVKREPVNRFGRPLKTGTPVAAWVDRAPECTAQRYVAVGFSKPTFWPQDALTNASDDARGKLALALSSHVEVFAQLRASNQSAAELDLTKEATDLVMQNSRIEATWSDEEGKRDEPGAVWALAVIDFEPGGRTRAVENGNVKNGNKMPGWLDRLPAQPGRLYAAGYSGPTFNADDSFQYAGDSAVQNLAASLRSHVQAYTLLVQTQAGMSVDDFAHTDDPDAAFLELVRKSARVEQVWVDEEGARAGDPPGAVWALAGIDVGNQKGGYQAQQNDALGPALDAHGNAASADDPNHGQTLSQQAAAQARQNQAVNQAKVDANQAAIGAHNAEVKQAVQSEQQQYRDATETGVKPDGQGGAQAAPAAK